MFPSTLQQSSSLTPQDLDSNSIPVDITTPTDDFSYPGRIWSASDGFVRIFASVSLQVGSRVGLAFEGCMAKGEVAFCQHWTGQYNIGVQLLNSPSTRREPRFPIQGSGSLSVLGDHGPSNLHIELRDVSASGLGMIVDRELRVGVCVEVKLDYGILFGEIRYSEKIESGRYQTGMKMYHMISREIMTPAGKQSGSFLGWFKRHS